MAEKYQCGLSQWFYLLQMERVKHSRKGVSAKRKGIFVAYIGELSKGNVIYFLGLCTNLQFLLSLLICPGKTVLSLETAFFWLLRRGDNGQLKMARMVIGKRLDFQYGVFITVWMNLLKIYSNKLVILF